MYESSQNSEPLVTIILATYNRPETLQFAVRSVLCQTFLKWKLLVIGDNCDERTQEVMNAFLSDDRIDYINISKRTGSQAIPNSAGMSVAKTKFISLLNHDDIWLPDHLELGVNSLEKNRRANFFMGKPAHITKNRDRSGKQFLKNEYRIRNLQLRHSFSNKGLFEPASAWIFRKELFEKTGPWKSQNELYRTPLQDWTQRAWRSGAVLITSPKITCIKIQTHINDESVDKNYESSAEVHENIFMTISGMSPDRFRAMLKKESVQSSTTSGRDNKAAKVMDMLTRSTFFSYLYYWTGFDIYTFISIIVGRKKGMIMEKLLLKRTNEQLKTLPQLDEIIEEVSRKYQG